MPEKMTPWPHTIVSYRPNISNLWLEQAEQADQRVVGLFYGRK
jgi:hypothetical protein